MSNRDRLNAYRKVFSSDDGQIVLQDLIRITGASANYFNPDSNSMYYNQGRKSMVFEILEVLEMPANKIAELGAENDRSSSNPNGRGASTTGPDYYGPNYPNGPAKPN